MEKNKKNITRRTFLKKTVYTAPTLIILGNLAKPTKSKAGFGNPPSSPTWN